MNRFVIYAVGGLILLRTWDGALCIIDDHPDAHEEIHISKDLRATSAIGSSSSTAVFRA